MPDMKELRAQVASLSNELGKRSRKVKVLERYRGGGCPIPDAITQAKVTKAYRMLMPVADAPWGALITASVMDRLEVSGLTAPVGNEDAAKACWNAWQELQMDADSKLGHDSALAHGRVHALVWTRKDGSQLKPDISLNSAEQMIVKHEEGSRRRRIAALRVWTDGDYPYATLYRPDGIYKFRGPKNTSGDAGTQWEQRQVDGENWPLENPLGEVPVVELRVNGKLKPGPWPYARGEYEHATGLIDRINLLTFLGLVVAFWMGFPLRGVIGDKILRDDDNNPLPPFDAKADSVFQLENPNAKLAEYAAADRKNLAIFPELDQLAAITQTPRHYWPLDQGMSNISADAIRAEEGGLAAKVTGHKAALGEGWEETNRLLGRVLENPVELSPRAQIEWMDHESRSLAERADAATKLKDILPWQALAQRVLNASPDDIRTWEAQRGSDVMGQLVAAARATPTLPLPAPANGNGNGAG